MKTLITPLLILISNTVNAHSLAIIPEGFVHELMHLQIIVLPILILLIFVLGRRFTKNSSNHDDRF